jgi:large subunit ribosomal protein L22
MNLENKDTMYVKQSTSLDLSEYKVCSEARSTERISPRKLNLVAQMIRKLSTTTALSRLQFLKVRGGPIVAKALKSAIANASHNYGINNDLVVLRAIVGCKGHLKRGRPASRGACPIKRKFAEIYIILGSKHGS